MRCDEVRLLLNAHLDGEIHSDASELLDSHIATCSSCAAALRNLYDLRGVIRGRLRYRRAPQALRERVRFGVPRAPKWRITWNGVAAAVFVCILASAPFVVNEWNRRTMVAEELLSAHVRALMGRDVDVVSSESHTVKPWFNGKLPFSPPVLDIASQGFPLEGARLDYIGGDPVAVLVYRRRLHRIDVFVRPSSGSKAPGHFARNGFSGLSWSNDGFLFTAVSDLQESELTTFTGLLMARQKNSSHQRHRSNPVLLALR